MAVIIVSNQILTKSEQTVLQMIVGCMTDNEIAFALDISTETLEFFFKNINIALHVSDKTAAAEVAIEQGLVAICLSESSSINSPYV
jgi:DNA-binding NarL/FixJ family response regulator